MATDRHQAPSYPLRMPDELKAKVAESAEANSRSLHAELLLRLEESFRLNKNDADLARDQMKIAELRVRENQLMHHALHLANCTMFFLQAIKGPDPKGALEVFADLVEISEKSAEEALAYERELNPAVRLEEYRKSIEETKNLLRLWRPGMLGFFAEYGDDDDENALADLPSILEHHQQVVARDLTPIPKKATNTGPVRSRNARQRKS